MNKISRKGFLKIAAAAAMSGVTAGALAACNSASSSTASGAAGQYIPGTYEGTAEGISSTVKVTMTFSDSAVTDVVVDTSGETASFGAAAADELREQLMAAGSAEIDGVSEYRLDNGLTVLLAPDVSQPTITVNITYRVGSRHEGYGETGMAHLLEHLLFKGTPAIVNLPQELSRRGMRPNGTTSQDRINYFESFAANDESLDWALGMEADRMVNALIAEKDLRSEMTVVRNEMERGENSASGILMQKTLATAYQWHGYGRSVIGARSDVENVRIENLRAFYRTYYQPDNAVLIVAEIGRASCRERVSSPV